MAWRSKKKQDKDAWVDWLSDESPSPTVQQEIRSKRVSEASGYKRRRIPNQRPEVDSPAQPSNITINIDLTKPKLPKLPKLSKKQILPKPSSLKLPKLPKISALDYKYYGIRTAAGLLAIVLIFAIWGWLHGSSNNDGQSGGRPVRKTPSFKPIVPRTEPELASQTPGKTAYNGQRDSYSYQDSLQTNSLVVSEQPLPKNLGSPEKALSTVAARIGADHQIGVGGGTAYINTNADTGTQLVAFERNGVLILINSPYSHKDDIWKIYIDSLQ